MIEAAGRLLHSIAAHGPFLLFVLPVVGALLVRLSRRFGEETVRRTAYANIALSIAVALNVLLHFQPESPTKIRRGDGFRFQSASQASFELLPAKDETEREESTNLSKDPKRQPALLRIAVGVDGFSVWFVALIPLVTLPAIDIAGRGEQAAGRLVALLLLESLLLGAFAAVDALFFLICLELAGLVLLVAAGRWSAPQQREEAVAAGIWRLAGSLAIGLALAATVIAHQWTAAGDVGDNQPLTLLIESLTDDLPPADGRIGNPYWHALEPFVFVAFAIGCLLKAASAPMLCGRTAETGLPAPFVAIPMYAVVPCLGVYGYLRFAASVGNWSAGHNAATMSVFIVCCGLYCGLIAATRRKFADAVKYAASAHAAITFLAAAQMGREGVTAALFHLVTHMLVVALLVLLAHRPPANGSNSLARTLCVGALISLPGSASFVGNWWMLRGFVWNGSWFIAACSLLILTLCAWGLLFAVESESPATEPAQPSSGVFAVVLGFIVLTLGIVPQFVIERSASTVKRISHESRVPSEVRRD